MTMKLRSSDIYDAINLFKYSDTGQGKHIVLRQPPYIRAKYKKLALDAVDKLWWKYGEDEIGFADLPNGTYGNVPTDGWRIGYDIRLSNQFHKGLDLVGMSFTLAHEGVHLAINGIERIQEEVMCRTIECMYYGDMMFKGVKIKRKHTGVVRTFKLGDMADKKRKNELKNQYNDFVRHKLFDFTLLSSNYWKLNVNGRWAVKALDWWGGLANREGHTKAFLVREIIRDRTLGKMRLQPLVRILESSRRKPFELEEIIESSNNYDALVKLFESNKRHPTYKKWKSIKGILDGLRR